MRIEIQSPSSIRSSEKLRVRAILFNDGYEPIVVSRNAFVGPSIRFVAPAGMPLPESVEPTFGGSEELLTLQPFSFYGREREFNGLAAGEVQISATYRETEDQKSVSASASLRVGPD